MGKAALHLGTAASVLLVEDDEAVRFAMARMLEDAGLHVLEADSCASAVTSLRSAVGRPEVVVTDLRLPDGDAFDVLAHVHKLDPATPVFIVTGYGAIDLAVRAVKQGAEDFFTKPVDPRKLVEVVRSAVDRRLQNKSGQRPKFKLASATFEPRSACMQRLNDEIEKLRDADCSVLLLGETGTGKSVLARRIHAIGARQAAPFVDINCAGLSKDFVETELFGHERGAFTGAHAAKTGLLDAANGGTLFLDEIGDVDAQVQPKLLKVLEEKRFRRMGEVKERFVDIRLVAATHHDLLANVAQKQFRADLYYRISTVSLTVPPLRERLEDVVPFAEHLLASLGAPDVELTRDAQRALLEHHWPGNLRELKNVLERALLLRSGAVVQRDNLRFDTPSLARMPVVPVPDPSSAARVVGGGGRTLSEMEREHIESALLAEQGRVEPAAKRLGIPRSTLYQRIKDYGITPSKLRGRAGSPSGEPID